MFFYYDISSSRSFLLIELKSLMIILLTQKITPTRKIYRENNEKFKIAYHMKNIDLNKKWYNFNDFKKLLSSIRYHLKKKK